MMKCPDKNCNIITLLYKCKCMCATVYGSTDCRKSVVSVGLNADPGSAGMTHAVPWAFSALCQVNGMK